MKNQLKKLFLRSTLLEMAAAELANAQLSLLETNSAVEYATAMAAYQSTRIKRLRTYIATLTKEKGE